MRSALLGRQDRCGLDTRSTRRKAQGTFPGWTPGNMLECGSYWSGQPRLTPRLRRRKGQSNSSRLPRGRLELLFFNVTAWPTCANVIGIDPALARSGSGSIQVESGRGRSEAKSRRDSRAWSIPRRVSRNEDRSAEQKHNDPAERQGRCVVYQAAVGAFTNRYRMAIPGAGDEVVLTDS